MRFDDRIIVTGQGESARTESGLAEAWYDPEKPIRLEFRTLDGAIESVEGVVPFNHRLLVDGQEYRLSVINGERRFIEITAQACALPESDAASVERPGAEAPGSPPFTE